MTKQRRNFYLLVCSNYQHYQFSCTVSMENCHCHQLPLLLLPPWLIIILSLQSNQVFRPCISGEGVYHLHGCWTSLSSLALPSSCYVSGHLIVFNVMNLQDQYQIKWSFCRIAGTCWCRGQTAVLSVEPTSLMSSTSLDVEQIYHHSLSGTKSKL